MFFSGYTYPAIWIATAVPPRVFNHFAYRRRTGKQKNWLVRRDELQQRILLEAVKGGNTVQKLLRIQDLSLDAIEKYLLRVKMRETELTTSEVKQIAGIVKDLHSIKQLELGKPTEISGKPLEKMTPVELRELAKKAIAELHEIDGGVVEYLPEGVTPEALGLEDHGPDKTGE